MMLIWSGSGMRCECFMAKYFNASKEQTSIILVDGIRKVQGLDQTSRLLSRVAYLPFEEFRCTGTNCYSFSAKSSFGVVRLCLKSHPQFM